MKKLLAIVFVLLATGGLTYGVRTGVLGSRGEASRQGVSPRAGNVERGEKATAETGPRASGGRGGGRVSVEVAEVGVGRILETLSYVGTIMPQASVEVFSKVEGRLEALPVDVGSWVREGDLIARIEDDELVQAVKEAEASLRVAEATLRGKEAEMKNLGRELERARQLVEKNFISRQEVDTVETRHSTSVAEMELARAQVEQRKALLEAARIKLRHTGIRSPIAGYVGRRFIDPGTMVKTSTPIVSLVNIDPVKTLISVVERDYGRLKPGLVAEIAVDAYPARTFSGKVTRVSPVLDQQTRTADVEIEIRNLEKLLKPGMFTRVTLTLQKREASVLVPEAALVRRGSSVGVYKLDGERRAIFVPVEIGVSSDGKVEVMRGISESDRVVTLGAHLLQEGSQVQVVDSASP